MRTKLVIHHSDDASTAPQFEKINGYHRSKGFPISSLGFFVGYNWIVERDGKLMQARGLDDIGAHTAASCGEGHCNLVAYGVCLAGDFTFQTPTDAQLATLFTLWKALNYPRIYLHSDTKATACPGIFPFRNELNRRWFLDLKQQLKNALKALPRYIGTLRGRELDRKIDRLEKLI